MYAAVFKLQFTRHLVSSTPPLALIAITQLVMHNVLILAALKLQNAVHFY